MITYCDVVATLTLILVATYFVRKELWNRKWDEYFRRHEEREERTWAILDLVKTYYEGGRIQHKEADIAKQDVTATVENKAQELKQQIDKVPERVKEKVKEVFQSDTESGLYKMPPNMPGVGE